MFQPGTSITAYNAETALREGLAAVASGQAEISLAELTTVDSTAVATLLAWKRAAAENGVPLSFRHMPPNLRSLAHLYGVADLL